MKLKVLISLGIFILICLSIYGIPRLIKVENISCTDQYGPCSDYIEKKFAGIKGKSLASAVSFVNNNFKNDAVVSNFSTQYIFPDKIMLNVVVRKPKYAIKREGEENYSLINQKGQVVSVVNVTSIPTLKIPDRIPNVGEFVQDKELFALEVLNDLFYLYQIKEGQISQDGIVFVLPQGAKIIFPLTGDKDILIGSMRLILSRLNNGSQGLRIERVKEIDLRFKNPVLR